MTGIDVAVAGLGAWAPECDGWPALRRSLQDRPRDPAAIASGSTSLLRPSAGRRRVPDGIAVAMRVGEEALAAARAEGRAVASVFASAYGDLATVDYLCATLAVDPPALSPMRFHLSVHNAAAGHWSIARGDPSPTSATAAGDDSFALGLLEAATMAVAESRPVLLVAFDTPAVGRLARTVRNRRLFGFAMVLRPETGRDDGPPLACLSLALEERRAAPPLPGGERSDALAASSAAARALVLAEALVATDRSPCRFPVGRGATLAVRVLDGGAGEAPSIG